MNRFPEISACWEVLLERKLNQTIVFKTFVCLAKWAMGYLQEILPDKYNDMGDEQNAKQLLN